MAKPLMPETKLGKALRVGTGNESGIVCQTLIAVFDILTDNNTMESDVSFVSIVGTIYHRRGNGVGRDQVRPEKASFPLGSLEDRSAPVEGSSQVALKQNLFVQ